MKKYTYTLNPNQVKEESDTYKQSDLKKMTIFRLQEICRKERLVVPSAQRTDREGLIRLIMRFRGQKEYRHIQDACEGGMERIQDFLNQCGVHFLKEPEVSIPGTITLYQNTEMNALDGYQVEADEQLLCGNLLLVDENLTIYTCFYLDASNNRVYLFKGKDVPVRPLEKHQFSILYFPDIKTSEFLYDYYHGKKVSMPGYIESVRIPLLDIEQKEIQQADLPLVIDFGSCNTTMGICLPNGNTKIALAGGSNTIPSIIGIREKAGRAEILSGHYAQMADNQDYQDGDIIIFYDIKRWISDVDRVENVILKNGYKYQFSRRDMLRAYLDYLLDMAQQQFKCSFTSIQLLAPIRQKQKFQKILKELLPEYHVNCELDEGMAVLFHSINRLIREKRYEERRWYHALVLDCGGGTTDLTSGRFCIENNRVSYIIDLETKYENGDTNFGGNNLTYKILQLLKIRIVEKTGIGHLETGKSVWEGIQEQYDRAEEWLPTRFKEYEEKSREHYFLVKSNYYYLFRLAEQIKKQFFQSELCYQIVLSTVKGEGIFLDKWKLSFHKENQLIYLDQPVCFCVYLNEIEKLLRPDIYNLMEQFLDQKFEQGELMEYEMIKLTGQSCKSQLFLEALKQYVPGKRIQTTKQDAAGTELKMCCLEGALAYFMNCKLGYMKVNEKYCIGSLPYEIMAFTHEKQEKILIKSLDAHNHIGHISRFHIGNQLDLYLNDAQGRRLKTYYFSYDTAKFDKTSQEEIDALYAGTVIQEQTDIILEGEMKFFVWISRECWGFVVLPILRDQEHLYKGQETFFDFEDDTWELNYFDGRK